MPVRHGRFPPPVSGDVSGWMTFLGEAGLSRSNTYGSQVTTPYRVIRVRCRCDRERVVAYSQWGLGSKCSECVKTRKHPLVFSPRSGEGRPTDMGGPRDCWIEWTPEGQFAEFRQNRTEA